MGVGRTVRGGAVGRLTGLKVGNGFEADSVTPEGVAVCAGAVRAGAGVRRGGIVRLGISRGTGGAPASLASGDAVGVGKTVRGGGITRFTGVKVGNGVDAG